MKSIGPIIEKTEAFFVFDVFQKSNESIMYIGKDDREIISLYDKLLWLLPKNKILLYRAWDQIPYDNISPSKEIQSTRLETLCYLNLNKNQKIIVLTTTNAIIQKTIPPKELKKHYIKITKNSKLEIEKISNKLLKLGYERTSIVRDKSEFAIRGSIIDIFVTQFKQPIRIYLLNEDIKNYKFQDGLTNDADLAELEGLDVEE